MEGETFDRIIEALNDKQEQAMDKREQHETPGENGSKEMYFLGKDVGLARAKQVLRDELEVERE